MDLKSAARSHTEMALNVLSSVAKQPKSPPAARVQAAAILLDRGWGKAEQGHTVAGRDGGDIRVVIRQIIETVDGKPVDKPVDERMLLNVPDKD
jgi:hypothetical protein